MLSALLAQVQQASTMQLWGAFGFGAILGWYLYYINRYRSGDIHVTDLVTVVGVLGGTGILAVFPEKTDLFGTYGVGLFIGFFGYFATLLILVWISPNFDRDFFLDGRARLPDGTMGYPPDRQRAMIVRAELVEEGETREVSRRRGRPRGRGLR